MPKRNRGAYHYFSQYICRRCGREIPNGKNGLASRRLAVYCKKCAHEIAERSSSRYRPAIRIVRVRKWNDNIVEYRGSFSFALLLRGADVISDNYERF